MGGLTEWANGWSRRFVGMGGMGSVCLFMGMGGMGTEMVK